jgi:hypothetical protein
MQTAAMKVHPLCRMFNSLAPIPKDELAELTADIKANGIKVPILVNAKKDTILDGLTRWKIAHDLKLDLPDDRFEVFAGKDDEMEGEILSRNLFRRHMSDDQRVAVVSKLRGPALEKAAKARQSAAGSFKGKAEGKALNGKGSVAEQVAKTAGVSKRKGEQAEKVRKSGALEDVIAGKEKLHKAAKKAPSKKRKTKVVPFEDKVYAKWTQWLNRFSPAERKEVTKLVKGWIG